MTISLSTSRVPGIEADAPAVRSDDAYDPWSGMATTSDPEPQAAEPMVIPFALDDATTRQLRRWINQLYKVLDTDFPPFGVQQDWERIADELQRREQAAHSESPGAVRRDSFRDNPLSSRFELFQNGMLAGYVSYSMRAGSLRLHRTVVADAFEGVGLEQVLIRHVVLNAHKRRLSVLPYCHHVQTFLAVNPQYRSLLAR